MRYKWLVLTSVIVLLSGCSTVKGWLRPWVCECEAAGQESQDHDHEHEHDDPDDTDEEPLSETDEDSGESEGTEVMTQDSLNTHLIELQGVLVQTQEESTSMRKDFVIRGDLIGKYILEGNFERSEGNELVVITPGSSVDIYSGKGRVARSTFDLDPSHPQVKAMGIQQPVAASELVRDGYMEVVVYGVRKNEDTEVLEVRVLKVIGEFAATVFSAPLAVQESGTWRSVGSFNITRGLRHRFLIYTRSQDPENQEVYRWNHWEGMYRVPYTPPTAPGLSVQRGPETSPYGQKWLSDRLHSASLKAVLAPAPLH